MTTTHSTYSGGGFIADLGYDLETAQLVLEGLQYNNWIDRRTRALFVEFMLYEPTTNLFAFVRLVGSITVVRINRIAFHYSSAPSCSKAD